MSRSSPAGEPASPAGDGVFLLNNYRATGIGDFGLEVRQHLGAFTTYRETDPDGQGAASQLRELGGWAGPAVLNLGLTAWGASGIRNLLGYYRLGRRVRRRPDTVVLVHNLIETMDAESSGYPISRGVRFGAHLATSWVVPGRLVAFSRTVDQLLRSRYGRPPALLTPIPCRSPAVPGGPPPGPGLVVTPGYLSPYKGHERLPAVRGLLPSSVEFEVVGGEHRVLAARDPAYAAHLRQLTTDLETAGIRVRGHLPDAELDALLTRSSVALLPYRSTQGGSATFSRVASAGLPAVVTDLPEFRWLEELGAGLLIAPAEPAELATAVRRLLAEPGLRAELSRRQRAFAARFSWERFGRELSALLGGTAPL